MTAQTLDLPDAEVGQSTTTAAANSHVRVLHVINGQHYSGAERVQDLLALRLGDYGYAVTFACLKAGRFAEMRRAQSAAIVDLRMRSRFDLLQGFRLARIVKQNQFALIHTHTPRAALVGRIAAALAGVPIVHHLHSPTSADSTRRWLDKTNWLVERACVKGAAAVISVSGSLGSYARRNGIPAQRVHVVPNGVPVIGPLEPRDLPVGQWTLGTVALFRPRKGLEMLLEAIAMLAERGLRVRLRAVGTFETEAYRAEIHQHVARLKIGDAIDWTGFARDVKRELGQMDVFVLPSLFGEGLPMVILEAMAAGVPIVATRVEGVPEAIRDGVDGLIAAPGNPSDLAERIAAIIEGDMDWAALRSSAHHRQANCFSDHAMAEGVARVYEEVLGNE